MITLFQFPAAFNVPNASPYCLKLETWLRLAGLEYQVKVVSDPRKAPKGKLPYVRIEGEAIGDSEIVIRTLGERYGVTLDAGLDARGKGWARAITRLCDEHLYYLMLYFRWFDEDSWRVLKPVFFGSLPFGVRDAVAWAMRRKVRATLRRRDSGSTAGTNCWPSPATTSMPSTACLARSRTTAANIRAAPMLPLTVSSPTSSRRPWIPRSAMWREAIRAWWRIASGCGSGSGVSEATAATAAIGKCWSVYLVRAENGALYCGISDDPLRRFDTHCSGKGARFFHSSPARALVYVEACASKGDALRRERAIKALSKRAKERLLVGVPVLREVGEPAI